MEGFHSWDHAGLALAHAVRTPWLDGVFAAVTWLGSLAVLLPLVLLLWWRRRSDRNAAFVALALIGASALGHMVKLVAARPRPDLAPLRQAQPLLTSIVTHPPVYGGPAARMPSMSAPV